MNKTSVVALCFLILSLANPGYVLSEEIHGLSIGFSDGAEFHYTVLVGKSALDDFHIVVNEIGPIPDNFTSYNIFTNITGYWSNGTEILELSNMWLWVPIGNWTYVQWLLGFTEGPQIVDTDELWGAETTDGEVTSTMTFWKADGALYELHSSSSGTEIHFLRTDVSTSTSSTSITTNSTTSTNTTSSTTGSSSIGIPEIMLVSFAGAAVILVVAVVIIKKR
ncbi:MAG: hypothetical protein RTV72_13795 [Candidatus Thorarchaeota archaeon]